MYTSTPKRTSSSVRKAPKRLASSQNEKEKGTKERAKKQATNATKSSEPENERSRRVSRRRSIGTPSILQGRPSFMNRTTVRATPYKTPRLTSKVQELNLRACDEATAKKLTANVVDLLNCQWKVCYMSSLFNFVLEKPNLKRSYESYLKIKILETFPANELKVEFRTSVLPDNSSSPNVDALVLEVTCMKLKEGADEEELSTVYTAYFFPAKQQQMEYSAPSKWYPLMLYRGSETIQSAASSWFMQSFSCYVIPRGFPQSTLLWIAGVWTRYNCAKKQHNDDSASIVLQYKMKPLFASTQKSLKGESLTATISFERSDIAKVWKIVEKEEKIVGAEVVNLEAIVRFNGSIENHICNIIQIPAALLELQKIKTPCITLSANGSIKMTCARTFSSLIGHLIEIFKETYLTQNT